MKPITFDELKQAAGVMQRLNEIRRYVTRERFDLTARTRFGINDGDVLDMMYGMLQMSQRLWYYIANDDDKEIRLRNDIEKRLALLPKAIEIAEAAYAIKAEKWNAENVPHIEHNAYRRMDMRRYYYTEGGERHSIDIPLSSRYDILLLAELLKRDGVTLIGVAEHLGYLEGEMKGREREKFPYFEGDIYLLFGNPTDSIFYSYVDSDDAGVYVATPKGWRKLLYTPTRGYLTRQGEPDFADDKTFYSDHMLEGSGKGFLYVGNIHDDMSVLVEKKQKEE